MASSASTSPVPGRGRRRPGPRRPAAPPPPRRRPRRTRRCRGGGPAARRGGPRRRAGRGGSGPARPGRGGRSPGPTGRGRSVGRGVGRPRHDVVRHPRGRVGVEVAGGEPGDLLGQRADGIHLRLGPAGTADVGLVLDERAVVRAPEQLVRVVELPVQIGDELAEEPGHVDAEQEGARGVVARLVDRPQHEPAQVRYGAEHAADVGRDRGRLLVRGRRPVRHVRREDRDPALRSRAGCPRGRPARPRATRACCPGRRPGRCAHRKDAGRVAAHPQRRQRPPGVRSRRPVARLQHVRGTEQRRAVVHPGQQTGEPAAEDGRPQGLVGRAGQVGGRVGRVPGAVQRRPAGQPERDRRGVGGAEPEQVGRLAEEAQRNAAGRVELGVEVRVEVLAVRAGTDRRGGRVGRRAGRQEPESLGRGRPPATRPAPCGGRRRPPRRRRGGGRSPAGAGPAARRAGC